MRIWLALLLAACLAACMPSMSVHVVELAPLADIGAMTLGTPEVRGDGMTRIPFSLEGGGWFANPGWSRGDASAEVRGNRLVLRLEVLSTTEGPPAAHEPAEFVLPTPIPGAYAATYLDPDGSEHALGTVVIPSS
jgi:hypothetical protein